MWVKNKNTTSYMQQNASTEYKSARNKAKQLYKAFSVTGTAFFMWKLELLGSKCYYFRQDKHHYAYSLVSIQGN
jgi:hypothetical protein